MYKINIRGLDPVFVKDGETIFKQFTENKLPARVVLNGAALMSSDIRSVVSVDDTPVATETDTHIAEQAEYMSYRRRVLSEPAEIRARRMHIPKMVWRANNGFDMPESLLSAIYDRQVLFFFQHPNHMYANPTCYADLIERRVSEKDPKRMTPVSSWLGVSTLKLIDRILLTDEKLSRLSTPT